MRNKREQNENGFLAAIGAGPVKSFRVFAKMPDGRVGISAWYTKAEIENVKAEIVANGHVIVRTETKMI